MDWVEVIIRGIIFVFLGYLIGRAIGKWHIRRVRGEKLKWHIFTIDEKNRDDRGRSSYWWYKRFFWHLYKVSKVQKGDYLVDNEVSVWQGHLEIPIRKVGIRESLFAIRFHIGNKGSETPWDGHLTLFGASIYWGHSGFRKLAERLSRCDGYPYDTREWMLRISDNTLWWEFAQHDDMCRKNSIRMKEDARFREFKPSKAKRFVKNNPAKVKVRRRRWSSWRRGSINLSIPEAIWGPRRYSYEDLARFQTLIKLPEDDYAVILTLQKVYYGRTKVDKSKHTISCSVDVDAPRGIPTHVDHSGGYKGDRTFGFSVKLPDSTLQMYEEVWPVACEDAVKTWVERERARTGFVKPDPVERD